MIKSLRKRFILFSVLIISIILMVLWLLVFLGPRSGLSAQKMAVTVFLSIGMVFAGSWLLSNMAVKPIRAAWQKQLDFTADASHELRTPITVIQTNLELVMDSPEETVKSQMKWLRNIEAENKRMTKLVEDLLTLSRSDTGQQNLELSTFMLDELAMEALAPLKPVAAEKGIVLSFDIARETAFHGDRSRIKQLLIILADNALKYTDAAGRVDIALRGDEKNITLTVSDTGSGIAGEHLDKIFDRFYRVEKTRNQNEGGTGLGLSIAKWIAQEHHGAIRVASTPGEGTAFTVTLPR